MEQGTFHSCAREPCTHRSCKIRYAIIISYSSLLSIFGTLSTASHWPAITQYKRIDCLYSGGTLVVSNLEFIHSPSTRHNNFSIQKKKSKPSSTADNLIWHSLHHPCPMCCFFSLLTVSNLFRNVNTTGNTNLRLHGSLGRTSWPPYNTLCQQHSSFFPVNGSPIT